MHKHNLPLRRVQIALSGVVIVLCAAFLLGLAAASGPPEAKDIVTAKAFKLIDDNGVTRGGWAVRDDVAMFTLYDSEGSPRLSASVGEKDSSKVRFVNAAGKVVLSISCGKDSGSSILLYGEDGSPKLHLSARSQDAMLNMMYDKDTSGCLVSLSEDGRVWLRAQDRDGKRKFDAFDPPEKRDTP